MMMRVHVTQINSIMRMTHIFDVEVPYDEVCLLCGII